MHSCSIENVKFYLDENEYISYESYLLRGWVFGEEIKIEDLRLVSSDRKTVYDANIKYPILRSDVGTFYPDFTPNSSNSGFQITFKSGVGDQVILEAKIKNKWVLCETINIMPNRIITPETLTRVNPESYPAVVAVDNFYENPDIIRELALGLEFNPSGYHKGKRTELKYIIDGTREKIEQILGKKIRNWSSQPHNGVFQYCTPADPIVYHADSQRYAAVVFLTPDAPPEAGTSFYRHRKERWLDKDPARYTMWKNEEHMRIVREALMGKEHDDFLDPSRWEEVDKIGNKYNRFAMWDATLIHSATSYFGKSKENGRLFHMFFFDAY
jgi:hypothetical protein